MSSLADSFCFLFLNRLVPVLIASVIVQPGLLSFVSSFHIPQYIPLYCSCWRPVLLLFHANCHRSVYRSTCLPFGEHDRAKRVQTENMPERFSYTYRSSLSCFTIVQEYNDFTAQLYRKPSSASTYVKHRSGPHINLVRKHVF